MNNHFSKNEILGMDEKSACLFDRFSKKDKRKRMGYTVFFLTDLLITTMILLFNLNTHNMLHKVIILLLPIIMLIAFFKVARR